MAPSIHLSETPNAKKRKSEDGVDDMRQFTLLWKKMFPKKKTEFCKFLLLEKDENNRYELVEAVSYENHAVNNFAKLKEGYTYNLRSSSITHRKPKEGTHRKSELSLELKFHNVSPEVVKDARIYNVDPGFEFFPGEAITVPALRRLIALNRQFNYRLVTDVELKSAKLLRYIGCRVCKKSKPEKLNDGRLYCTTCKLEDVPQDFYKSYMVIYDMRVENSEEKELFNIVCYNDEAEKLFGFKSEDFKYDDDIKLQLGDLIGAKINLRLSMHSSKSVYKTRRLVAFDIKVLSMISRELETCSFTSADDDDCLSVNLGHAQTELKESNNQQLPLKGYTLLEVGSDEIKNLSEVKLEYPDFIHSIGEKAHLSVESPQLHQLKEETCKKDVEETELECLRPYTLDSIPHGYVLIINIYMYKRKEEETEVELRKGSEKDTENLAKLFQQLGFQVYRTKRDSMIGSKDVELILNDFKNELIEKDISSLFIITMGHGYSDHLQYSDGSICNIWTDIIGQFSATRCGDLLEKPKIFIFNKCEDVKNEKTQDWEWDHANSIYCFSALQGHKSRRNKLNGSYFINQLITTLRKHHDKLDFSMLMRQVEHDMQALEKKDPKNGQVRITAGYKRERHFRVYKFPKIHPESKPWPVMEIDYDSELECLVYTSAKIVD